MTTRQCPFCKQEMAGQVDVPAFSVRKEAIYRAVAKAGDDGIMADKLIEVMSQDRERSRKADVVLRVMVHEMNIQLAAYGQRIRCIRGRGYRLLKHSAR